MTYQFDGFNWLVRLERGELLIKSLQAFAQKENIKGAWVNGLGGASWAQLGFYDLKSQQYKWKKIDEVLEINGIQGNLSFKGKEPQLHLHGSFSDKNMQAWGGHIKELEVAATAEILIHRWYQPETLTRFRDPITGLDLLNLDQPVDEN